MMVKQYRSTARNRKIYRIIWDLGLVNTLVQFRLTL